MNRDSVNAMKETLILLYIFQSIHDSRPDPNMLVHKNKTRAVHGGGVGGVFSELFRCASHSSRLCRLQERLHVRVRRLVRTRGGQSIFCWRASSPVRQVGD